MPPLETINISQTPFKQNAATGFAYAYSGPWAFWTNQYSVVALNCLTGAVQWPTIITKTIPPPPGRPGTLHIVGDCWQSIVQVAASATIPNWLVATGAPNMCGYQGLQVWKMIGNTWQPKGLIDGRVNRLGIPRIVGDAAYSAVPGSTNPAWKVFDLATMRLVGEVPTAPAGEDQPDIEGYTYELEFHDVQNWTAHRQGGTPVANNFYPDLDLLRKQDMSIVWNFSKWLKDHNPTLVVPPTVLSPQVFDDVPPTDQFYECINSLGAAGIVVGRP